MSIEVLVSWKGQSHWVGRLFSSDRGTAVSFEYTPGWIQRADAFSIDPVSLPLRRGMHHSPVLFGAMQDCGPDRWGRILVERAVRKIPSCRKLAKSSQNLNKISDDISLHPAF